MEATKQATATPEQKAQIDVHALITGKFVEQLDKAAVPWERAWGASGPPVNLLSQRPFQGVNALILGMEEYDQPYFLTFDQVREIGGKVKRGTKGHTVIRWNKTEQGETADTTAQPKLTYYVVFNVAQCENIPARFFPEQSGAPVVRHEQIVSAMTKCPQIDHKGDYASYDVVEDIIHIPKRKKKDDDYYLALFRQLIHSTGHDSRLARKGVAEMSEIADAYLFSKEDLVADIGICLLLSAIGMYVTFRHDAGYVQGWKTHLEQDPKLLIIAAGQAQKAVDYILHGDKAKSK